MIALQIICNLAVYVIIYSIGYHRGTKEAKKSDYILEQEIRKIARTY
jgi:hypothetical protein